MKPVLSTSVSARRLLRVPTAARLGARGALVLLVGALVVGILGMHALATHGTPAASATTAVVASSHATAGETAGHRMTMGDHHLSAQAAHPAASADGAGSGHDMGSMVMLCVVMLAAAALTLLALLAVRPVGPLLPAALQPAAAYAVARRWVRGTGPPYVWAFSVIRC